MIFDQLSFSPVTGGGIFKLRDIAERALALLGESRFTASEAKLRTSSNSTPSNS
jgi:hypothetical protein